MIIFNLEGAAVAFLSLSAGWLIVSALGLQSEASMILAGPAAMLMDIGYRRLLGKRLLHGSAGPSLFYLPVWLFGLAWFLLGTSRLLELGPYGAAATGAIFASIAVVCFLTSSGHLRGSRERNKFHEWDRQQ